MLLHLIIKAKKTVPYQMFDHCQLSLIRHLFWSAQVTTQVFLCIFLLFSLSLFVT